MADEELRFRATGDDAGAGRMFDKLGEKAEDASDEIRGFDRTLNKLDEQIDLTKLHLAVLIDEFKRTGDMDLLKSARRDRGLIRQLEALQNKAEDVTDAMAEAGAEAGEAVGTGLLSGLRDTLGSLPAELKGAAIAGAVGIGLVMAPLVGAALGTAVIGGVGVGGIIGGIALAAKDSRVEAEARELGQRFMAKLGEEAQPFARPLVLSLRELQEPADDLAETLGRGFEKLAPVTASIARNLAKAQDALEPGLDVAFEAAVPVLRAIGNEIPEIAEATSDFLSYVGEDPDGAIMALSTISEILQSQLRLWGRAIQGAETLYEWILRTSQASAEATPDWMGWISPLATVADGLGRLGDTAEEDLARAKAAGETYVGSIDDINSAMYGTVEAATEARGAMVKYQESIEQQFDPIANLVGRLRDVKEAQRRYNEAVKEHGANSSQAQEANLALAAAVLSANTAAANASGTFDGQLTPALRHVLEQGNLTEAQIKDIERQFRAAAATGAGFAKTYTAKAVLDAREFYGSLAAANNALSGSGYVSGRASGGPVSAGQTYLVGEEGPELITMPRDGYVHDAAATRGMMSGASGGSAAGASGWSSGGGAVGVRVGLREPDSSLGRALAAWIVPYLQIEVMNLGGDADSVLSAPRR